MSLPEFTDIKPIPLSKEEQFKADITKAKSKIIDAILELLHDYNIPAQALTVNITSDNYIVIYQSEILLQFSYQKLRKKYVGNL